MEYLLMGDFIKIVGKNHTPHKLCKQVIISQISLHILQIVTLEVLYECPAWVWLYMLSWKLITPTHLLSADSPLYLLTTAWYIVSRLNNSSISLVGRPATTNTRVQRSTNTQYKGQKYKSQKYTIRVKVQKQTNKLTCVIVNR